MVRHFQYYNTIFIKRPDNCQLTLTLFGLFVLMGQFMTNKTCSKCNKEFPATNEYFHKNKDHKDGLRTWCKICVKTYQNDHKKIRKCLVCQDDLEPYSKKRCKKCQQNYTKQCSKERDKSAKRKQQSKLRTKKFHENNPNKLSEYNKKYRERYNKWKNNKYKNNLNFKLQKLLRDRLYHALASNVKSQHTMELLGCSTEQLKVHIESQFKDGMGWDNWSIKGWHIDHIRPCSSFDLSDPVQQKQCFHYSNLQPLWASENLKKNNKWVSDPIVF